MSQPIGVVQFAWETLDPYLFNKNFNESLILYDSNYNTTVADNLTQEVIPSLTYIDRILNLLPLKPLIIEIGCSQGEFVKHLRNKYGCNAIGYDPIIQKPNNFLINTLYDISGDVFSSCDLFIMRCVLPHINKPWSYLQSLFDQNPSAKVLIEYQKIEFIIEHKLWFSIGHGHVNQFTLQDFKVRFNVIDFGTFNNNEWQWVLINSKTIRSEIQEIECPISLEISCLIEQKNIFLNSVTKAGPIALYGGAGKGIILAEALVKSGADLLNVIDSSEVRFDKYLEVSGVKVISPTTAIDKLTSKTKVLVCNPNHFKAAKFIFDNVFEVKLPGDI